MNWIKDRRVRQLSCPAPPYPEKAATDSPVVAPFPAAGYRVRQLPAHQLSDPGTTGPRWFYRIGVEPSRF